MTFGLRTSLAVFLAAVVGGMSLTAADASAARLKLVKAPPSVTHSSVAKFAWKGAKRKTRCRLDSRRAKRCHRHRTFRGLRAGRHRFVVRSGKFRKTRVWKVMDRAVIEGSAPRPPRPTRAGSVPLVGVKARLAGRGDGDLAAVVARLRVAGVRVVREDVSWATLEPQRDRFDWSSMDRWVAAAAREQIEIVALPNEAPTWATGAWNRPPTSGEALDQYAHFVRALIERYGTNGEFWHQHPELPHVPIRHWDIWNEPYVSRFWATDNFPDPAGYAHMFKTVVQTARPADPNAQFMLEADTRVIETGWPWKPFLTAMFDAEPDLAQYADAVSVHPYQGDGGSPHTCTPFKTSRGTNEDWRATVLQFCRITDIRRILDAHGAQHTKIWITEIGWTTAPNAPNAVTEQTQATRTSEVFELLRTTYKNMITGIIWYEYQSPEQNPNNENHYYGLTHPNNQPKPAWTTLTQELKAGF
jgi:hypothetical protein